MRRLVKILAICLIIALCVSLPLAVTTLILCLLGIKNMLLINIFAVAGIITVVVAIAYFTACVKNDYQEWRMTH